MGDINKWCPMCGAAPGEPCKVISGDPEAGEHPGDERKYVHFYRNNDEPITVLVPDEPDYEESESRGPGIEGEGQDVRRL